MVRSKLVESKILMILIIFPFLLSCATAQQIQQEQERRGKWIIDTGYYSIEAPFGWGWGAKFGKEKGSIIFMKENRIRDTVMGITIIHVFRNEVAGKGWHMSEEEIANDYRNQEEKKMIEAGVKLDSTTFYLYQFDGEYKLEDLRKDVTSINGKKLYTMTYKATAGTFFGIPLSKGPSRTVETALYLYFPPNIKEKHNFYCFLISETYLPPSLLKIDLTQIYHVIRSFQEIETRE